MSEENNGSGTPNPNADLLARTEALAQQNEKLSKQLESVMSAITQAAQPKVVEPTDQDDLEVLAYKDPKAYAKKIQEQAAKQAEAIVNSRLNAQQHTNAVLTQLTSDYPELADSNSELTKRAVEIYNSLSPSEKQSPSAYKIAVRDAAADVGLLPKSKRKQSSSDDFSFGGGSGGGASSRSEGRRSEQLPAETLAFAEALGMNIKDKAVVERLKSRAQRKNWNKYE